MAHRRAADVVRGGDAGDAGGHQRGSDDKPDGSGDTVPGRGAEHGVSPRRRSLHEVEERRPRSEYGTGHDRLDRGPRQRSIATPSGPEGVMSVPAAENPYAGQGTVLLDIGGDVGALVVTMPAGMEGVRGRGPTFRRPGHRSAAPPARARRRLADGGGAPPAGRGVSGRSAASAGGLVVLRAGAVTPCLIRRWFSGLRPSSKSFLAIPTMAAVRISFM